MQTSNAAPFSELGATRSSAFASPSPLMTLDGLAALLARTPAGLRATIHSNTDFGGALRGARVKLGRRVYFRRDLIDRLIEESTGR
jgi:hypothetical protein